MVQHISGVSALLNHLSTDDSLLSKLKLTFEPYLTLSRHSTSFNIVLISQNKDAGLD